MRRIVVRLSLITVVATVLAYGWLEYQTFTSIAALHRDSLRAVARDLAAALQPQDGAAAPVLNLPPAMRQTSPSGDQEYHYAVRAADGTVIYGNGWTMGPLPKSVTERDGVLYEHDPDGIGPQDFVGVAVSRIINGRTYWVQVEQSNDEHRILVRAIAEDFFDDGGWTILPLLLALLVGSILTIRKTLTPLDSLSRLAATIGPETPDVRLPEADIPSEILPMVRAFNLALDRLEDGYRLQREFTADAAHELRTPLAVLRAQIDLLPAGAETTTLRAGADTMSRLVQQLLTAARMDVLAVATDDRADLAAVAAEVTEFLSPLAIGDGKEIEVIGNDRPAIVRGHAEALFDALRNLAENALTYSPEGGVVTLKVAPNAIAVIDRGDGIVPEIRSQIFARFWRADRLRSGAGLGLSIVQRIAEAHGATLRIEDTPGGGATFRLTFPDLAEPQSE